MKYVGSKNKIAKHILPIMLAERKPNQWWVEPFVGGANMIDKVTGKRLGNDVNEYLIALLIAVRDGYVPPTNVSRDMYHAIKAEPHKYPKELVGFVGHACSFGGIWFGGYACNKRGDNYAAQGSRSIVKQAKYLKGVVFKSGSYLELEIPENSLIYCDPPYANTRQYNHDFDSSVFWEWCRAQAKKGHIVYVSEYSAPSDFVCVKEIPHKTIINRNTPSARVERLFRYRY